MMPQPPAADDKAEIFADLDGLGPAAGLVQWIDFAVQINGTIAPGGRDGRGGRSTPGCLDNKVWIVGSLIDDGDDLGTPPATIANLTAVQGPAVIPFGVPTEVGDINGRPCGTITVAADGGYTFAPAVPGLRQCEIQYTLTNAGGSSTASETFVVPEPL